MPFERMLIYCICSHVEGTGCTRLVRPRAPFDLYQIEEHSIQIWPSPPTFVVGFIFVCVFFCGVDIGVGDRSEYDSKWKCFHSEDSYCFPEDRHEPSICSVNMISILHIRYRLRIGKEVEADCFVKSQFRSMCYWWYEKKYELKL